MRSDMVRFLQLYREEIMPRMIEEFHYKNRLQVPRLEKIVVNMGLSTVSGDAKEIEAAAEELSLITGQRPCIRRAKKSISNFKLRGGTPIGCKVTLRRRIMYEFLERLICIALPRIRDFKGLSPKSFDGRGNFSFGLQEQVVFPEVDLDKVKRVQGMDITMVTTAETDNEAAVLLRHFGVPFVKT